MKPGARVRFGLLTAAVLLAVVIAALLWYPPFSRKSYQPVTLAAFTITDTDAVNVNTADSVQLMLLPGIGAAKAQAIIEYREENGAFYQPEDLLAVPGIGPAILEGLQERICF